MRAKEFIVESELDNQYSSVLPLAYSFPTMPSSDPYQYYRFGLEMASDGRSKNTGPAKQGAVVVAYTKEEEQKIKTAIKQTGHKGEILAKGGSVEPKGTQTTSPVAKPKKNKYGV